jgi:hypothetical protein
MNTQTVVDQLTSKLAERRQQTRDRRTAYLHLARAICSDGSADQHVLYALDRQPTLLSDRRGCAA